MTKKIYVIIFLVIPLNLLAEDQDSVTHIKFLKSIEINTGLGRLLINDQIGSPMNYQGIFFPVKLNYNFNKGAHQNLISLFFFKNNLKSKISSEGIHEIKDYYFMLDYNYLHEIFKFPGIKSILYLGIDFNTSFSLRTNNMITNDNLSNPQADCFSGFNLSGKIVKQLSKRAKMNYELQNTLFKYVLGRTYSMKFPPNGYNYDKLLKQKFDANALINGDFINPLHFVDFSNTLSYEYTLKNESCFTISYIFRYYQYNKYSNYFPVKSGLNGLLIGLRFNLK